MVRITLDGRIIEAEEGEYLLAAIRRSGVDIPTLCEHPDLEPVGACRLCMVEVTHEKWKGHHSLVTSCLYPVEDGLVIRTTSARVKDSRRGVLRLLLARAPHSKTIQALARRYHADESRLENEHQDNDCILCGLCTRVCQAYSTSAIATLGRGTEKYIGSGDNANDDSATANDDCVLCGACASLCPTGVISARQEGGRFHIWNKTKDAAVASINLEQCIGCGRCEESCPFYVARIRMNSNGELKATIPVEHCRGCGVCVGACPVAAITQDGGYDWNELNQRMSEFLLD